MYETLIVKQYVSAAVVTVNRPEVDNAINHKVQAKLRSAVVEAGEDDGVGALIFGIGHAQDMVVTSHIVSASEAFGMGLISRAVADNDLLATANEVPATVITKGPLAVRLTKLVVRSGVDVDQRSGLVVERLAQALPQDNDDKREGMDAFLAKRPPRFTGK